jgi:dTDP-4-dehydrorhamnose 3,5-epimerase-like enzyme
LKNHELAMLATIDDLKPVVFRLFSDQRGVLVPVELSQSIPFKVVRFFWIFDVPSGGTRGSHAHKACHQYMICAVGSLHVDAFDGHAERVIPLTPGQALHVPPAILTTERFDTSDSVLMVFCDRPYEVDDYLDDRAALVAHRQQIVNAS